MRGYHGSLPQVHDELGQLLPGIKLELRMVENHSPAAQTVRSIRSATGWWKQAKSSTAMAAVIGEDWTLAVADISIPDRSGLGLNYDIKRVKLELTVLVISGHPEKEPPRVPSSSARPPMSRNKARKGESFSYRFRKSGRH